MIGMKPLTKERALYRTEIKLLAQGKSPAEVFKLARLLEDAINPLTSAVTGGTLDFSEISLPGGGSLRGFWLRRADFHRHAALQPDYHAAKSRPMVVGAEFNGRRFHAQDQDAVRRAFNGDTTELPLAARPVRRRRQHRPVTDAPR